MPVLRSAGEGRRADVYNRCRWRHLRLPYLPATLQVEPSAECNLQCRMCTLQYYRRSWRPALMDFPSFRRLVDQFPRIREVILQGTGEPLLCGDIFRMADLVRRRGGTAGFNTNGMLLSGAIARRCVRAGLTWLHVSLDAVDQDVLGAIRVGADAGRIIGNLERLAALQRELGSSKPELAIVMVLMRSNLRQLAAIVRLAAELNVPRVFVQGLSHTLHEPGLPVEYAGVREFVARERLSETDTTEVAEVLEEAGDIARRLSVSLRVPRLAAEAGRQTRAETRGCDWPWHAIFIGFDGSVMPCCMVSTPDRLKMGNILEQGLLSIWNGAPYRSLRLALAAGKPPPLCQECAAYRGEF